KNKYFSTWLTRILINSANEFLKKKKRDIPLENVEEFISYQEGINIEQIDLVKAINNLKKKYREVIILFYFHDLPIKEISNVMDIPENTVKTYPDRGEEQLNIILIGAGHVEGKILSGNL